jgi:hypothetical protein
MIVLLAPAFTGALANPTGNSNAGGVARAIYQNAHVRMYGSDTCDDGERNIQTIDIEGANSHRCIAANLSHRRVSYVSTLNRICEEELTGERSGCTTQTWSQLDCTGNPYTLRDSGCHSIQYGAVSIDCN